MSDAELAERFNLAALPPGFADDPFPTYRALLDHAPLKKFPDGSVMLSRWEDLDRVYRDTATFSSDKHEEFAPKYGRDAPLYAHHTTSLVFNDPPLHTRVRRILVGALTPRVLAAMEPGLIALVDRLLDELPETPDLIEDFASRIPIEVIGNLFDMPHD
ncbi:MAG: cytochrome P450, partial [Pseudomonadota bacterium]